jgi:hypothetical protein
MVRRQTKSRWQGHDVVDARTKEPIGCSVGIKSASSLELVEKVIWNGAWLKNAAADAGRQRYGIEVDQKSDSARTQSKICQQLRFMQRAELFDRLEFQDDLVTHDDIRQIARFYLDIVVSDRQTNLLAEWESSLGQLMTQAPLIDGFKQPWAKTAMHAHR